MPSASMNLSSFSTINVTMKFVPRRSDERGNVNHGWLKTFHTFAFGMYQDRQHQAFGPLRVMNEDRVEPHTGFVTHSHREFEIFSYVVSGELEHQDSMGNTVVLKRGDIQMTSGGTGMTHSEKAYGPNQLHFLQIWSLPSQSRLQPKYYTRHFSDSQKTNQWARVVAPVGAPDVQAKRSTEGPAPVHSALTMYAIILEQGKTAAQALEGKKAYMHVIQTSGYKEGKTGATVKISSEGGEELILREGDGAYISVGGRGSVLKAANDGNRSVEVVLFDLE